MFGLRGGKKGFRRACDAWRAAAVVDAPCAPDVTGTWASATAPDPIPTRTRRREIAIDISLYAFVNALYILSRMRRCASHALWCAFVLPCRPVRRGPWPRRRVGSLRVRSWPRFRLEIDEVRPRRRRRA